MRLLLKGISLIGLGLTVIPAVLVAMGALSWTTHASFMIAGMLCWFLTAPWWIKKN